MPRRAREPSPSGIYHAMVRGIAKMDIFPGNPDKKIYLHFITKVRKDKPFYLLAYCLMNNHAHLLIKEEEDAISSIMKSLGIRYSKYFNTKYERVGHLFQDRFKSEVIKSTQQSLVCTRYIHNNPVKAGLVALPSNYPWSSYCDYIGKRHDTIANTDFVLGEYSANVLAARTALRSFTEAGDWKDDVFMDYDDIESKPDEELGQIVKKIAVRLGYCVEGIPLLRGDKRTEIIRIIKAETGASSRDLAKVLGLSKNTILRCLKR